MRTFSDLDNLLLVDEDKYRKEDLCEHAEELIANLQQNDIPLIKETWKVRDHAWQTRFCHASAHIPQAILLSLLEELLAQQSDYSNILDFMGVLPKQANDSILYQSLLDFAERLWYSNPNIRNQIQMSTWSCGLSGRLRNRLGFTSWSEAGL